MRCVLTFTGRAFLGPRSEVVAGQKGDRETPATRHADRSSAGISLRMPANQDTAEVVAMSGNSRNDIEPQDGRAGAVPAS
jgi:hypothetical protein